MNSPSDGVEPSARVSGLFTTTHWSVVLAAGQAGSPRSAEALENLCRTYWYPLYVYIRRRGYGAEDAQDLTQGFLSQLLERQSFARADPGKGRFRSFLLAALNYYLADERDRSRAQKRGGGRPTLSFDAQTAEQRYHLELADCLSPDKAFERQWALALLDQVLVRLEQEFRAADKAALFQRLRGFLVAGTAEENYADAAAELAMTGEAVKKAVHRLRRRYSELFREEIAHTVGAPTEVEEEMRHLCALMAG
jgi:RNA polymerase sigma-70 factor (ECF subfamily)